MPDQPSPTPAPVGGDLRTWLVYLVRELGLTTCLIAFICYMLAVQLPALQSDFRTQTDRLAETVANNSRAMGEMSRTVGEMKEELRALRLERRQP